MNLPFILLLIVILIVEGKFDISFFGVAGILISIWSIIITYFGLKFFQKIRYIKQYENDADYAREAGWGTYTKKFSMRTKLFMAIEFTPIELKLMCHLLMEVHQHLRRMRFEKIPQNVATMYLCISKDDYRISVLNDLSLKEFLTKVYHHNQNDEYIYTYIFNYKFAKLFSLHYDPWKDSDDTKNWENVIHDQPIWLIPPQVGLPKSGGLVLKPVYQSIILPKVRLNSLMNQLNRNKK